MVRTMSGETSVENPAADAPKRVLLVEDETGLRTTLGDRLTREGYAIETAADGDRGFSLAADGTFDLILLDVMLPGRSGFDICRELRQQGVNTPILMLTARGETVEKVLGLKIGADDYLTKPFETLELLARVEALLRRAAQPAASPAARFQFGDMSIDVRRAELTKDGVQIPLSAKEFQLLSYFLEHRGEALSRDELLKEVWGYGATTSSRTVDVHIAWLRQKIEQDLKRPRWITTVHGIGYRFAD
jgi:two-component system, OmpR family, alkaline phosphatase synthesis response regulator PhoP